MKIEIHLISINLFSSCHRNNYMCSLFYSSLRARTIVPDTLRSVTFTFHNWRTCCLTYGRFGDVKRYEKKVSRGHGGSRRRRRGRPSRRVNQRGGGGGGFGRREGSGDAERFHRRAAATVVRRDFTSRRYSNTERPLTPACGSIELDLFALRIGTWRLRRWVLCAQGFNTPLCINICAGYICIYSCVYMHIYI